MTRARGLGTIVAIATVIGMLTLLSGCTLRPAPSATQAARQDSALPTSTTTLVSRVLSVEKLSATVMVDLYGPSASLDQLTPEQLTCLVVARSVGDGSIVATASAGLSQQTEYDADSSSSAASPAPTTGRRSGNVDLELPAPGDYEVEAEMAGLPGVKSVAQPVTAR